MHTLFPATLLILAALTAPAVQAGASATTRIGNVTLAVLDLTPQDGSNPGFTRDSFDSRLLVYADTRNTGGDVDRHQVAPVPHAAGVAQLAPGPADVRATTSGAIGDVVAHSAASTGLGLDNIASAESEQRLWLTLAPHTLLTVAGNVFTEASRTLAPGQGYRVFTWASVDITDTDQVTTSYLSRESSLIWGEATTLARNDEFFTLAYANPGDTDLAISLNFLAYNDITATAVPEPATWATLLAGLVLAGAAACRSRTTRCGKFLAQAAT